MTKKRVQSSFGSIHKNEGTISNHSTDKYEIDYSRQFYILDVIPMGAPRMTQSDKWKTNPDHPDPKKRQREVVTRYFAYKNMLTAQCKELNFQYKKHIEAVFLMPMPASWSNKKKERMNGTPHEVKPDWDNIAKGLQDALKQKDSDVWKADIQKRWAWKGSIILFE